MTNMLKNMYLLNSSLNFITLTVHNIRVLTIIYFIILFKYCTYLKIIYFIYIFLITDLTNTQTLTIII